jgi:hypothetical protein
MKCRVRIALLLVAALLAPQVGAQSREPGPYLVAAAGRAEYDYDCYFFDCDSARANAGKLVAGYRFGVFALEAVWMDFGRAPTDWPLQSQRTRAGGLSAVWTVQFGASVDGSLRAGLADVRRWREPDGRSNRVEPTFGLAVAYAATPAVAVELAWDVARFYGNDAEGTSLAKALTVGLRLRW